MSRFARFGVTGAFVFAVSSWQSVLAAPPSDEAADAYHKAVIAARRQYDQSVAKASAEYVNALKAILAGQVVVGDQVAAARTRDKIKWLEKERPTGDVIMEKLADTVWINDFGMIWEWRKDGSLYRNGIRTPCAAIDDHRVVVVMENNWVQQFVFDAKFHEFEQWKWGNVHGPWTVAIRIKPKASDGETSFQP
jgi:hypothetical protein